MPLPQRRTAAHAHTQTCTKREAIAEAEAEVETATETRDRDINTQKGRFGRGRKCQIEFVGGMFLFRDEQANDIDMREIED